VAGGQILAFPINFDRRPYNTLALPCECVMNTCPDCALCVNRKWAEGKERARQRDILQPAV